MAPHYNEPVTLPIPVYTFRTITITEHGWISHTATTMESNDLPDVEQARRQNLNDLHDQIAKPPPPLFRSTWQSPYDDLAVTVRESIIQQDLMTGRTLSEDDLEEYTVPYSYMERTEPSQP